MPKQTTSAKTDANSHPGVVATFKWIRLLRTVAEADKATLQNIKKDKLSIETIIYFGTGESYRSLEGECASNPRL